MSAAARDFKVVFICTGNRFRSPIAAELMRRAVDGLAVGVESLGTLDLGDVGALPEALEEAALLGLDLSAHRCRPVRGSDLSSSDLVIGFERKHVVSAVVDGSAPLERTFTLPELDEILTGISAPAELHTVDRARWLVDRAGSLRQRDSRTGSLPELPDPLGGGPVVFRRTAERIRELTARLAGRLFA